MKQANKINPLELVRYEVVQVDHMQFINYSERIAFHAGTDNGEALFPEYFLALWSTAPFGFRQNRRRLYLGPHQAAGTARILRVTAMQWELAKVESEVAVIACPSTRPSDRYATLAA